MEDQQFAAPSTVTLQHMDIAHLHMMSRSTVKIKKCTVGLVGSHVCAVAMAVAVVVGGWFLYLSALFCKRQRAEWQRDNSAKAEN